MRNIRTPLVLSNIEKRFRDGENVLDGVNLKLEAGSITGLLGRNGAGKTTLIRTAIGLLKADAGHSEVFGHSSWDLSLIHI